MNVVCDLLSSFPFDLSGENGLSVALPGDPTPAQDWRPFFFSVFLPHNKVFLSMIYISPGEIRVSFAVIVGFHYFCDVPLRHCRYAQVAVAVPRATGESCLKCLR